jgi:hypothetical protein
MEDEQYQFLRKFLITLFLLGLVNFILSVAILLKIIFGVV